MEETLVIIKPDGIERKLIGDIITRYEKKGLEIKECKMLRADMDRLSRHYSEHIGRDYYQTLVEYMMRGNIIVMILEGENAIDKVRKLNGVTKPIEAELGSIRGDYAMNKEENLVHASDSEESFKREREIWF